MKGLLLSLSQDYTVLEIHPLLRRYIISQNVIGLNVDEVFRYHPEFSFVTEVLTKMDAEKLDQHTVNIPFHTRRVEFARMKFDRDVEVNVNRCCLDKEQSIFLFFTDNIEYLEEFYGLLREKENLYINSMTILKEISMTIMNEPSSKVAARKSVEMICRLFGVHSAIMRMLKNGRILEKYVSYGFEGKYLSRHLEVDIYNVPLYKRVIEERRTIIEENPEQSLGMLYKELTQFSPTEMFIVLPIMNNNQAMGILALNFDKKNRIVLESIDILENIVSELNFLQAKSDYFQELLNTTEKLKSLNLNIVTSLSDAIETRDPYTKGHSERVGAYSVEIARNMGLDDYELERLRIAGVLHDIGKVGIPDAILLKPSALSKNEFEIMKLHPELSAAIVSEIESFTELVPWVRYHHENFDGTGYPHKLKGKDIPLGARIIAVADAFDAMTSTRPYRKAMSIEKGARHLPNGRRSAVGQGHCRCCNGESGCDIAESADVLPFAGSAGRVPPPDFQYEPDGRIVFIRVCA